MTRPNRSTTFTVRIRIDGARETLAAFRRLPKEASAALRDETLKLTQRLESRIAAAALGAGSQAALMAATVKARRDRVPSVVAGGSKRVGRHRVPAYKLLFGSEFGMNRRTGWYAPGRYAGSSGRQYRPHQGRHSYWFFKTVEDNEVEIGSAWQRVAAAVVASFSGNRVS